MHTGRPNKHGNSKLTKDIIGITGSASVKLRGWTIIL